MLVVADGRALADAQVGLGHRRQVEEVGLRRQAAGELGAVRYQIAGIGLGEAAVPGQPAGGRIRQGLVAVLAGQETLGQGQLDGQHRRLLQAGERFRGEVGQPAVQEALGLSAGAGHP